MADEPPLYVDVGLDRAQVEGVCLIVLEDLYRYATSRFSRSVVPAGIFPPLSFLRNKGLSATQELYYGVRACNDRSSAQHNAH